MPRLTNYQVLMVFAAVILLSMFAIDYALNFIGATRTLDEISSLPEVENDGK